MSVASGLAIDRQAHPDLAKNAVRAAMEKSGLSIANSVLLFLTPEFAREPQEALLAASKAASCTQILGCTAPGIFTEEDWVLDAPAAAAMVFGGDVSLSTLAPNGPENLRLSLAAPNALNSAWISAPGLRFGAVSGDATGYGPFKVWANGKVSSNGRTEAGFSGAEGKLGVSQGIRPLSAPLEITQVAGFDVQTLVQQPALNLLARDLPLEVRELDHIPLHLLMAGITYGDAADAIPQGRFRLAQIISANAEDRSVTLSARLTPGERIFWAIRQPLAAEHDMRLMVDKLQEGLPRTADFGICFPCMGRGPYFYGGVDRDLELVKQRFPRMPLIGFYGNGEIAPANGVNQLFQYAAVLALFNTT